MNFFKNKILLITGGTGSFGGIAVQKIKDMGVKEIRVFSRDEKKQEDMRILFKNKKIKFYIGDVRNLDSIDQAMQNVDYVFHAAALKQVPTCEFYPIEAVRTNILGTENVLNAAIKNKVKKVVLLSTDKAVYPINAMGVSKSMMEKIMIAKSRLNKSFNTIFCATRYGNVIASRGSVIPHFINQIKSNKPITITEPKMTRFLMTLDESVDLVLYAFKNANQGDIFVQKAPASTIKDLALVLKEIFNAKNSINIIGTRHGEKQYESLLSREEMAVSIENGKYFRIPMDKRDLNYDIYFIKGQKKLSSCDEYSSDNTNKLSRKELKKLLLSLDYIKKKLNA
jgi:UDP-N-acetylglucosamine 4,6-dehydratase/5-epimerase